MIKNFYQWCKINDIIIPSQIDIILKNEKWFNYKLVENCWDCASQIQDEWKCTTKEEPGEGSYLISNGRGYWIAWWAPDWKKWCEVGSRDMLMFLDPEDYPKYYKELPKLPIDNKEFNDYILSKK